MAEESRSEFEYDGKGELPLQIQRPVHVTPNKSIDSSAKNSLSSGTPTSVSRASPNRADCYWFAQCGDNCGNNSSFSDKAKNQAKEREDKARLLREKQSEERHRKLEELKSAAVQAQRFRELQEEERRKKIEDMKIKETDKRSQVEERKKQIFDAEMERRGYMLRRSQDREAKIEAQKNAHRSSIGFAFGSSTPRMLDAEPPYLFSSRRAASQSLLCQPMTLPQSRYTPPSPNGIQTNPDTNDNEHAVRRRLGTSHSIDLCTEPVNFAHRHSVHETFFHGTPEPPKVLPNSLVKQGVKSDSVVNKNVHLHHSLFPWEAVDIQLNSSTPNAADIKMSGILHGSGVLVGENIMTQSLNFSSFNRGRRRTDLIPTAPAYRDSPRTRSPGKAYSMTRLDLLSQPRGKRPLRALKEEEEKMVKTKSMGNLNSGKRVGGRSLKASYSTDPRMSKSTSHLAGTQALTISHRQQHVSSTSPTLRSDLSSPSRSARGSSPGSEFKEVKRLSQSMWQLSPSGQPKPTRSSILRQNALAAMGSNRSMLISKNEGSQLFGGEVGGNMSRVASSPSRPQSSMSQQSFSSHSTSSVTMRTKPSRKARPFSVAGSISDRSTDSTDSRQGRSIDKKAAIPPTGRPPRAKSAGPDNILKEAKETKKGEATENGSNSPDLNRTPTKTQNTGSPKEKPKIARKPGAQKQTAKSSPIKTANTSEPPAAPPASANVETSSVPADVVLVTSHLANPQEAKWQNSVDILNIDSENNDNEMQSVVKEVETAKETVILPDVIGQPKVDDTAVIQPKPKITTEEEAKAVLAEKRRKAREQAEREAELERQRLEELRLQEEERLRLEEEAQREWELEVERQRKAEEERLQKAIEEQAKREEEERLKKEEEARLKADREKAEQIAREEQERSRKEAEEKFNREEEERAKRRKRVEDIMARTRARDKAKKETGNNSTAEGEDIMVNSMSESFTLQPEMIESSPANGRSNGLQTETILKNAENRVSNSSSAADMDTVHTNGFNNHNFNNEIDRSYQSNCQESIIDSQCTAIDKEVSVSTLLNNLSELDLLTPTKISSTAASNSTAFSATKQNYMEDHIRNEDNVNFNVETNVNGNNYTSHQDSGVTDLLL